MIKAKTKRQRKYHEYLNSPHWRIIASGLKRRYGKCQECGSDISLQVHHLTYARMWKEEATDLVVLCDKCHKLVHTGVLGVAYLTQEEFDQFNSLLPAITTLLKERVRILYKGVE